MISIVPKLASASKRCAVITLAAAVMPLLSVTTANAVDYRYWTSWTAGPVIECKTPEGSVAIVCEEITSGQAWTFAKVGAQDIKPVDQSVLGWRFAVSVPSISDPPELPSTFAELCPAMSAPVSDQHRVAVVIDFGLASIAPAGETPPTPNKVECISLEVGQSAADALVLAASDVRADGAFLCGIDGYPAKECGVEVDAASLAIESATAETSQTEVVAVAEPNANSTPGWLWPVVGVVVLLTLVVIFISARRGKSKA